MLKKTAFCHLHITRQSLSSLHRQFKQLTTFKSNKINKNFEDNINISYYKKVHISTRGRPQLETNSITITRRFRAPNKITEHKKFNRHTNRRRQQHRPGTQRTNEKTTI